MLFVGLLLLFAAEATSQVIPLIVAKAYDALINQELSSSERMKDIKCPEVLNKFGFL